MKQSDKITFGDGGSFQHPGRPVFAESGVRAAARFLSVLGERKPQVIEDLHTDVFSRKTKTYLEDRLRITAQGPALAPSPPSPQIDVISNQNEESVGLESNKVAMAFGSQIDELQVDRDSEEFKRVLPLLESVHSWMLEFHLHSPNIFKLILHHCRWGSATGNWEKLTRFLADGRNMTRLAQLIRARAQGEKVDLSWVPNGVVWEEPGYPAFRFQAVGWQFDFETRQDARDRIISEMERSLTTHFEQEEKRARREGCEVPPWKLDDEHFEWLVDRQIRGVRPSETARRSNHSPTAVRDALNRTAALVGVDLRPVKAGPPEVLEET